MNFSRAIKWALVFFGATVALVGIATFLGGGHADIPFDYEVHGTE